MYLDVAFRTAHDIGLATWFGGYYMGAVAMNGASREIDDPRQRARVVNAGWFRWASIVPLAVGAHLAGAAGLTFRGGCGNTRVAPLERVRAAVTVAALLATVESGRAGRQMMMHGDVPVATAVQPIAETPDAVASAQRRLRVVQWLIPFLTAGLVGIDAWQREASGGTRLLSRLVCRVAPALRRRVTDRRP